MCGNDIISWPHLRRAILRLNDQPGLRLELIRRASNVAQNLSGVNFIRLVTKVWNHHCSDSRDKLYGILSLTPAALVHEIHPNYSMSTSEVYKNAFLIPLRLTQRLDLFQFCGFCESSDLGLSWVPNWSASKKAIYWYSYGQAASHSIAKVRYIQPHTLEVTGVQCATIRTVGKVASGGPSDISRTVHDWGAEILQESDYIHEPMLNAFVRLLVFGRVRDSFPHFQFPTFQELLDKYGRYASSHLSNSGDSWLDPLQNAVLRGFSFVTTHEGYIGLCFERPEPSKFSRL